MSPKGEKEGRPRKRGRKRSLKRLPKLKPDWKSLTEALAKAMVPYFLNIKDEGDGEKAPGVAIRYANETVTAIRRLFHDDEHWADAVLARADKLALWVAFPDWPVDDNPADVVDWLRSRSKAVLDDVWRQEFIDLAGQVEDVESEDRQLYITVTNRTRLHVFMVAVVYRIVREIEEGLRRPVIAVPCDKIHADFLDTLELFDNFYLCKYFDDNDVNARYYDASVQGSKFKALFPRGDIAYQDERRDWQLRDQSNCLFTPTGQKLWLAILALISIEGKRQGTFVWETRKMIRWMGHGHRSQSDKKFQDIVTNIGKLLRSIKLIDPKSINGETIKKKLPVLCRIKVEGSPEPFPGKTLADGMPVAIDHDIYHGVRHADGELGTNWFPLPAKIIKISAKQHDLYPRLPLVLAMRLRWALNDGRTQLRLTGEGFINIWQGDASLLDTKNWRRIERQLDLLVEYNFLKSWYWESVPRTPEGMLVFMPAEWIADRVYRRLSPIESHHEQVPATGLDLYWWRKERGYSQKKAAEAVGVSISTVSRAEKAEEALISTQLRKKLEHHLGYGGI